MSGKTCYICGRASGMFPLCQKCNELKNVGKIVKCDDCGTWYNIDKGCLCKKTTLIPMSVLNSCDGRRKWLLPIEKASESLNKNLGYVSDDRLDKFKKSNPLKYACVDGHYVRSKSEVMIDNYLFDHDFVHAYEYSYRGLDGTLYHPDFYIKSLNLYIEYFGMENDSDYTHNADNKRLLFLQDSNHGFGFLYPKNDIALSDSLDDIIYKRKKDLGK
jgi:hypothetical protein